MTVNAGSSFSSTSSLSFHMIVCDIFNIIILLYFLDLVFVALYQKIHMIQLAECIPSEIGICGYFKLHSLRLFYTHTQTEAIFPKRSIRFLHRWIFPSRTSKWRDIDMESINIRSLHLINAFRITFTLTQAANEIQYISLFSNDTPTK